jgi:hypothetical protein
MCIHHYEGSWTDSGGPYWGGLQMDLGFQSTYGGWLLRHKGTADHWSPMEQIWVAVRAARSRGFSPWPNTARYCGVYSREPRMTKPFDGPLRRAVVSLASIRLDNDIRVMS